jgi:hypothetical protein
MRRPLRAAALAVLTVLAFAPATAAHAGCVEDFVHSPRPVDPGSIVPYESRQVVTLVTCSV